MNKRHRILTVVCLALFWLSCLYVPWELTEGTNHFPTIMHAPIFAPPTSGSWAKRQPHPVLFYEWGIIVISYAGLFLLMKPKKDD
jgi:hypothetical protein